VECFSRAAAAKALTRLQQPDLGFGNETPVRAAWAEALGEPDAQTMAQVWNLILLSHSPRGASFLPAKQQCLRFLSILLLYSVKG